MFRSLFIIVVCILLAGCSGDISTPDATGGRLLDYERGKIVLERKLTEEEARKASDWLKEHGKNWSKDFVSYAPDVLAYLEHSDGTSSGLYVFDKAVVFVNRGNQMKKDFAESETKELMALLGLGREG